MTRNTFNKAIALGFAVFSLAGFSNVHADNCSSCFSSECNRWCDDCSSNVLLKCAQPTGCDDCGFFFGADFLYWTTYDADLDYAYDNSNTRDVAVIGKHSKLHFVDYSWEPGFRVFGGYHWGCDGWDAQVIYTYWSGDGSDSAKFGPSGIEWTYDHIKPTLWHPAFGSDRAHKATAKIDLDYQVLDVLLSRPFCISKTLITRPYFGFRALWLDQDLKVTYTGGRGFSDHDGVVKWDSDFDGYGLHAGMDWYVKLCNCFGLYAGFGGSILAGETNDHQTQSGPEGSSPPQTLIEKNVCINENQWIGVPGYNLSAGLSWDKCCGCTYYIVKVGYEMNYWYNKPQIRRYVDDRTDSANTGSALGSLLLHGLTAGVEIHF